jgi:hypothetical protein
MGGYRHIGRVEFSGLLAGLFLGLGVTLALVPFGADQHVFWI